MRKLLFGCFLWFFTLPVWSQSVDTLSFYSSVFKEKRTIQIHQPEFSPLRSDSVLLPVIYVLDGQHDWFVEPVLNSIRFLQYTHEIPQALVVVIPHTDRNNECIIQDLNTELPLDVFIRTEVDSLLSAYNPHPFRMIIGHSFSSSFALHALQMHPEFYHSLIAHSPMDELDGLLQQLSENAAVSRPFVAISVGGLQKGKDYYHRKNFEELRSKHEGFLDSIHLFLADYSNHSSVPIAANATLLSAIFSPFSARFTELAEVNENYELIHVPRPVEEEFTTLKKASKLGGYFYPPEIPELNGLSSRYSSNNYEEHAAAVDHFGLELYPSCYDFHFSLYNYYSLQEKLDKAKFHLLQGEKLLKTVGTQSLYEQELLEEIKAEKQKYNWSE